MISGIWTYVDGEIVEVPDARSTRCVIGDRIVNDKRVVLANVVGVTVGIREVEARIAITWHVLLIFSPTNALRVQEVHNGGNIAWDVFQVIIVQSPEVASPGGEIVGLARVGYAIVASEKDTLCGEVLEDRLGGCLVVVGVFEPDLDEAIENGTGNIRGVLNGSVRRTDIERRCVGGTNGQSVQLTTKKAKIEYTRGCWCSER